jgi:glycosyl hydrolase family 25
MTIFYPDYSSFQGNTNVPVGTPAVVAKATEGNYYQDLDYDWYKSQAAKVGAVFSGYHFLKSNIDPAVQARYYYNFAGNVPCMLDVETEGSSSPTVDEVVAFMSALKGLGGHVWGVYFPRWYWGQVGGDLSRLTAAGAVVIASEYRSFDDHNWPAPYGGVTPPIWQYTSTPVDMNAFDGTPAQLAAIINGSSSGEEMNLTDTVTFSPNVVAQFPELAAEGFGGSTNVETLLTWTAARVAHLVNEVNQLKAGGSVAGAPTAQQNAAETLAELKARL